MYGKREGKVKSKKLKVKSGEAEKTLNSEPGIRNLNVFVRKDGGLCRG